MPAEVQEAFSVLRQDATGWVRLHPRWIEYCEQNQLGHAGAFLDLPGEIVSGHVHRHVMEVKLPDLRGFLKKEHRVRWRDRFANRREGFGWVSRSEREARLLQELEQRSISAPRWIAYGEGAFGKAFLLLEAIPEKVELRAFLQSIHEQPERIHQFTYDLASQIAEIHEAGFSHPDLYAKHLLIDPESGEATFIDWQRSRRWAKLPLRERVRSLAALDATLTESLVSCSTRERFLQTYLRHASLSISSRELGALILQESRRLSQKKSIREQRNVTGQERPQRLIWLDGEQCCVIPEMARFLGSPEMQQKLYDPCRHQEVIELPGGRQGRLQVGRYRMSMSRWWDRLRGKAWRAPEMKIARHLFALERQGFRGAKLLAFGQRENHFLSAEAFVLIEETPGS